MTALSIQGLCKRFGPIRAVEEVSLALEPGQAVALLGPNGSGKTTVLRCVVGLAHPDRGDLRVLGQDVSRDPCAARARLAFLPQVATFPRHASVRDVLQLHARLRGVPWERAPAALRAAGLGEELLERLAGDLSVGTRHRLALAVAQLADPAVMVLDEPTASLDPAAAVAFREQVRGWRAAGRAVLFTTHVLADAEELADRVVVLVGGRVVTDEPIGTLRARLQRRALLCVTVPAPSEAHLQAARACGATEARLDGAEVAIAAPAERRMEILQALARLGPVLQLRTEDPSLESVYLDFLESKGGAHAPPAPGRDAAARLHAG